MKKSNIIVIAFSAFIVISILIFYIDGKKHEGKDEKSAKFETVQLPDFSVVVAEEDADVHVIQSDTVQLKIEILKDSEKKQPNYSIANDTLHIYKGSRIFVYNNNTQTIISKKASEINVVNLNSDSLKLELFGGNVNLYNDREQKSKFIHLNISAKDSASVEFNGNISSQQLTLNVNNSEIYLYSGSFRIIKGNLENHSRLTLRTLSSVNDLQIKRDDTSSIDY
jgi:3D (Asp-Asp-Asp) domain-containing protein